MEQHRAFRAILTGLVWIVGACTAAHAQDPCKPLSTDLQLRLDMPLGCMTRAIVNEQIDHPDDVIKPRKESPADTERRITTFSEWRASKPNVATSSESAPK